MPFQLEIGRVDLAIIIIYLVVILSLGLLAGIRQRRATGDAGYFLAGRSLTWPAIGLALFATNISTLELVSLAEEGYKRGLLYANTEMLAPITLIILALFFAPFYIRSGIETLPSFLEKRYSRGCRYWLVLFALGYAIFGHLGFALFTGGKVVEGLFNIPLVYGMAIILALTGVYTIVGGLKAVVWTEVVQTVILLVGMAVLTVIAYNKVGGWSNFTAALADEPERLQLLRSDEAADDLKWYAVLLGYPVIGIWFWCTDQTIVQRVLGAKDENHAQVGALFAGFIKVAALFLFVLPGMFCYVLVSNGTMDKPAESAQTLPFMVSQLLPWGVRGLVAAAMLSALMSTVAGALNSTATVCCYDIYKQIYPEATDRATIRFGRIVTFAAMLAAIAWAPSIQNFGSILEGNTMLIAYMAPSVTAVFLWGVFWRGASAAGAIGCLAAGAVLGTAVFILDFGFKVWFDEPWWTISFMMTSFYLFLICSAVLFILSKLCPQEQTAESQAIVWDDPLAVFRAPGWPGIGNYKFLTALLLALVVAVYWMFR